MKNHLAQKLEFQLLAQSILLSQKMVDKICLRTRQYARKQIQWFMNEPYDLKLNLSNDENNILQIDKILKEWNNSI